MSDTHHHHHHHHEMDSASKFKRDSLKAIEQRKIIAKWGKIALLCIAFLMGIAVIVAYTVG